MNLEKSIAELAIQLADFLGEKMLFSTEEILINQDYIGEGYGVMGNSRGPL